MLAYDLDIRFGFGQIGIDTYPGEIAPRMDIQGGFQLEKKLPEFSGEVTQPIIVDIDFSKCRAEMGCPGPQDAAAQWFEAAKQYAIEYIGQKAAAGDALGAIEKGVSIADVVESESYPPPPEINVDAVPKTPPKITFKMGEIRGELNPGYVKVDVPDKPVTLEYQRAKVNIFMEKEPFITVKARPVGENIDISI
jgi:hypothetical protein